MASTEFIAAALMLLSKLMQSNKMIHHWIITQEIDLSEEEKFVDVGTEVIDQEKMKFYDPLKRDCEFTKAYDCNLWELEALLRHQHPRIRKMAQEIIDGTFEKYQGNLLMDFKGINFLDKISYKNPKKLKKFFTGRSSNIDQPLNMVELENLNTDLEHGILQVFYN